jgi:hypothetical protein
MKGEFCGRVVELTAKELVDGVECGVQDVVAAKKKMSWCDPKKS